MMGPIQRHPAIVCNSMESFPTLSPAPSLDILGPPRLASLEAGLRNLSRFDDDCPDALRQAIWHSLLAPCKRLRPALVLLASEACGGYDEPALPAACAVEMLHTYSLIHDDLPAMDDDDLRRGRPTCHVVHGEALAILAGDALLTRAFEVLATEVRPASAAVQCVRELSRAAGASGMVGGQSDDLAAERSGGSLARLEAIHRRKTAALITASVVLGGHCAQAGGEALDALRTYGRGVGLAFQIVDDLLDLSGDESRMGKRGRKDATRGKLTYPGLVGREESEARGRALVDSACAALHLFGEAADPLRELAHSILSRVH